MKHIFLGIVLVCTSVAYADNKDECVRIANEYLDPRDRVYLDNISYYNDDNVKCHLEFFVPAKGKSCDDIRSLFINLETEEIIRDTVGSSNCDWPY